MFKYLWNLVWSFDEEEEIVEEVTLEEAFAVHAEAEEKENCTEELEITKELDFTNYSCMNKTGKITSRNGNNYQIDNVFIYYTEEQEFEAGTEVSFTVYAVGEELRVVKVQCLDAWNTTASVEKSSWCNRKLVTNVIKRNGRQFYVSPGNVWCDLNKVKSEFVPIVGDWIELEVKVEIDENIVDLFGNILEVVSLTPLRVKILEGKVNQWNSSLQHGNVNGNIFFDRNSCEQGYLPRVADKVVVEAIESTQGSFSWRAVKLLPASNNSNSFNSNSLINKSNNSDITFEKEYDVVVSECSNFEMHFNEKRLFMLKMVNYGKEEHLLFDVKFKTPSTQYNILNYTKDKVLKSNETFLLEICLEAKCLGASKETLILDFKNFQIHRNFVLYCQPQVNKNNSMQFSQGRFNRQKKYISNYMRNIGKDDVIRGEQIRNAPRFIAKRLFDYPVPESLRVFLLESFENGKKYVELVDHLSQTNKCLLHNLTFDNYEERFHLLLYVWEMSDLNDLRHYDQERAVFIKNGEFLMLEIEHLNERRPSLIAGDKVVIWNPYDLDTPKYEGIIHKVGGKHVFLKFTAFFHDKYDGEDYTVQVVSSRTVYKRMHQSVNLAVRHLGKRYMFPNKVELKKPQLELRMKKDTVAESTAVENSPQSNVADNISTSDQKITPSLNRYLIALKKHKERKKLMQEQQQEENKLEQQEKLPEQQEDLSLQQDNPLKQSSNQQPPEERKEQQAQPEYDIKWFNKSLNEYQRAAVANILLGEARPMPYIIFGPPGTGKTVTIIEIILQILRGIPDSRLMIATPSNSSADLIATRLIQSGVLLPGDLVRLIAYRCVNEASIPAHLVPYATTVEVGRDGTHSRKVKLENGIQVGLSSKVVGRHRITVGTCMSLGQLYSCDFPKGHFTHFVIDEAGQAVEPELLVPLAFLEKENGQVILAGDPLQLGPVISCNIVKHFGLDESFLERFISRFPYACDPIGFPKTGGYDPRLITRLLYNYRSLPEILTLPNNIFYRGDLKATISPYSSEEAKLLNAVQEMIPRRTDKPPPAVVFHGVMGENYQTEDCPSWFNPCEASLVFYYLNELFRLKVKASEIGIITPYLKQVHQIRNLINEAEFDMPKLGSVEEFQGQEFNVVILSTVRSNERYLPNDYAHGLGFVSNPRRLNVALTRAKVLLIIVGNPYLLYKDAYWRNVIDYCIDINGYKGCEFKQ